MLITSDLCRAYNYPDGFDTVLEYPANRVMLDAGFVFHNYIDWSYTSSPWAVEAALPDLLNTNGGYALEALTAEASNSSALSLADALTASQTATDAMSYLFDAYANFSAFFDKVDVLKRAVSSGPDQIVYPSADEKFDPDANVLLTFLLDLDTSYALNLPADELDAHPAHVNFPGNFSGAGGPTVRTVNISGAYEGLDSNLIYSGATRDRMHSTGLYVKAGTVVSVRIPAVVAATGEIGVHVGCHRDDISGKDEYVRMPVITRSWPIKNEVSTWYS